MMKKSAAGFLALILALCLPFASLAASEEEAYVIEEVETTGKPYLSLGADLNEAEKSKVLGLLNIPESDLDNYQVHTVTNEEEHQYLDSYLSSSIIGTRALSSVLVQHTADTGITVITKNINYCTEGMYRNAMITAGMKDAAIVVAGPFEISGTAALVGTIKAYEAMTGEKVSEDSLDAANNELVITGEIVENVGDSEKVEQLIGLVKQEVAEGNVSTSEDIDNLVDQASQEIGISLSAEDRSKITSLMEKINDLDLDVDTIKEQAEDLYNKLDDLNFDFTKEDVGNFLTRIINAVVEFFRNLF